MQSFFVDCLLFLCLVLNERFICSRAVLRIALHFIASQDPLLQYAVVWFLAMQPPKQNQQLQARLSQIYCDYCGAEKEDAFYASAVDSRMAGGVCVRLLVARLEILRAAAAALAVFTFHAPVGARLAKSSATPTIPAISAKASTAAQKAPASSNTISITISTFIYSRFPLMFCRGSSWGILKVLASFESGFNWV